MLEGGASLDILVAGSGDTFVYSSVLDSTSFQGDQIVGADFDTDTFQISGFATVPVAIDAAVTTGTLNGGLDFDADLGSAIGAGQLGAHHAVLFTPNDGSQSGKTYLIIDINGTAGYQASQDLVIEMFGGATGTLDTADFI